MIAFCPGRICPVKPFPDPLLVFRTDADTVVLHLANNLLLRSGQCHADPALPFRLPVGNRIGQQILQQTDI